MIRSRGKTKAAPKAPRHAPSQAFPCPDVLRVWFALLVLLAGSAGAYAVSPGAGSPSVAKPVARIPVQPLGYQAPGALYLLSGISFDSLDFVDSRRLLFTFHETRLLRRGNNGFSGEEQMIHALVLNLPNGQVSASADWLMGDKDRYLWPLGDGRFLVREGDSYYTTDASLNLHVLIGSPNPVRMTEVSPDGRLLMIEVEYGEHTPEPQKQPSATGATHPAEQPPDEGVELALVDVNTKVLQAAFRVDSPIVLPMTSAGYLAEFRPQGDNYQLRFIPFQGKQVTLGSISSSCAPQETFLNSQALLIQSCNAKSDDISLDTWTIDGKKLWHGVRNRHNVWPTFAAAQNGSRFAIGLLQSSHPVDMVNSLNDPDVKRQLVQVFDTDTGSVLLKTNASPILSAGQNFALSPDGSQLAVLRNGAIEVYDVPSQPAAPASQK